MTARLVTLEQAAHMLRHPTRDHSYQQTRLGPPIREYLAWKRMSRAAERTLDQYERDLARMAIALADRELRDVTSADLLLVLEHFPVASRRRALAAISGFFLHMNRHTVGTELVEADVDSFTVRDWLGHADTRTTEVYVHNARGRLQRAVAKRDRHRQGGEE